MKKKEKVIDGQKDIQTDRRTDTERYTDRRTLRLKDRQLEYRKTDS